MKADFSVLELSTKLVIWEAQHRGYEVEVLDYYANIIKISGKGRLEYIKQASITSRDSYISYELLGNKQVSKHIISNAGINVPKGFLYDSEADAVSDYERFNGKKIVIKPNTTNYGIGISILKEHDEVSYGKAIEIAFSHDKSVIIEDFFEGLEYRFLVIGGKTMSVINRMPANVVGDGQSNIKELVASENQDPKRGSDYASPMKRIVLGDIEQLTLADQGYTAMSIPEKGEMVYLRKNSNVSTGGYSVNVGETMSAYNHIAEAVADAMMSNICGVDILIDASRSDFASSYCILEANYNPALYIHKYPKIGDSTSVECFILDYLDLT